MFTLFAKKEKTTPSYTLSEANLTDSKGQLLHDNLLAYLPESHFYNKLPNTEQAKLFRKFDLTLVKSEPYQDAQLLIEFNQALKVFLKNNPKQTAFSPTIFGSYRAIAEKAQALKNEKAQSEKMAIKVVFDKLSLQGKDAVFYPHMEDYFSAADTRNDLYLPINGSGFTVYDLVKAYDNANEMHLPEEWRKKQDEQFKLILSKLPTHLWQVKSAFEKHQELRQTAPIMDVFDNLSCLEDDKGNVRHVKMGDYFTAFNLNGHMTKPVAQNGLTIQALVDAYDETNDLSLSEEQASRKQISYQLLLEDVPAHMNTIKTVFKNHSQSLQTTRVKVAFGSVSSLVDENNALKYEKMESYFSAPDVRKALEIPLNKSGLTLLSTIQTYDETNNLKMSVKWRQQKDENLQEMLNQLPAQLSSVKTVFEKHKALLPVIPV